MVEVTKKETQFYVLIFKKEPEGSEKREHLDGGGLRRAPSLNLAPTKSGYLAMVGIEDFWLKESNDRNKERGQPSLEKTAETYSPPP